MKKVNSKNTTKLIIGLLKMDGIVLDKKLIEKIRLIVADYGAEERTIGYTDGVNDIEKNNLIKHYGITYRKI